MSFPTYRNYRPSGELWLGQVPAHWTLRRLGFYFIERRQKVSDKVFKPLSVSKAGIVPQIETAAKTDDGDNRKRVNRGDFVINSRSDRKGSSGVSELEGSVSLINTVLIPQEPVCMRFIHHLFRSVLFQEEYYRHGKGIVADLWSTNFSEMKNICLSMPPSSEQEQIASFLDQETSKIDALISEQQRLIELLKEKRQAVISHAVTKGLNPDVRMKPSGVEWLGEVPEQWEVQRLKYVCQLLTSNNDKKTVEGEVMIRLCNYTDVYYNEKILCNLPFMEASATESQVEKFTLRKGDTIITKDSESPDDIAIPSYVPKNLPGVVCGYHLAILRPFVALEGLFLSRLFQSNYIKSACAVGANGLTRYGLSQAAISDLELPVPPVDEQIKIASFLEETTSRIDSLVADAVKTVSLLQERRTALISAAVTGKIDVRNYASTQKDAA